MNFDDLLNGRDISELTDEEINGIVSELNTVDLERFQQKVQVAKATKTRKPTAARKAREDLFEKMLLGGGK